jgi:putative ABC transport system permease protein
LLKEKLDKVLPEALAKVDLSPEERRLLETIMRPPTAKAVPHKEVVLLEEFTVIGVFRMPTEKESRQFWRGGYDSGDDLWLPMQTAKELYAQMPYGEAVTFRYVIVVVDDEANVKDVLSRIETMGYRCDALLEFIEREQFLYKLIFAGMTCVAGVALLVAGLGITNTMLMSVLERTREVGIMKAVGAAEEHVQFIFLLEGALIGLAGGILGVLLSWAFSIPGDQWIRSMVTAELKVELEESLFQFPLWLIVGVIAFCSLVTTLAAFYPARRAARVNPVAALRHE